MYLEPEASPAVSISSDDGTNPTNKLDGEYDSEHDSDVNLPKEDNVDALYSSDLNGDVNMERDGDNEKEQDEEQEDGKEVQHEDEYEDEDEDDDDGKEPQTISQGEMVNTLGDNVDSMVDDQPTMLPEKSHEMREHTPWRQPLAPGPQPQTLECHPRPQTLETHPFSWQEIVGSLMPQNPRPAAPCLQ